jgi:adenylyl- and sulfurtransferase ThiI
MVPQTNLPNYRVILCHYNEIGLKSDAYKSKLEDSLIAQIKNICKREKLNLQSLLKLQNRLLFFFPTDQMPKVITIFRNIIGIQSISPAITSDRDLNNVKERAKEFGIQVLPNNTPFWVKFKSITALSQRFEDIEKEIARNIQEGCMSLGKDCKSNKKKPKVTIFIEMREKGAYIYHLKIPTIWGGMPLELSRALIAEWLGSPYDCIASHFLHHRGSLVFPILLNLGQYTSSIDHSRIQRDIEAFAKFYADPVTYFTVNFQNIFQWLETSLNPKEKPCFLCNAVRAKFFLSFLKYNSENGLLKVNDYTFYPKALISSINDAGFEYMPFFQNKELPVFYPLASFRNDELNQILKLILNTENILYDMNSVPLNESFDLPLLVGKIPSKNSSTDVSGSELGQACPIQSECLLYRKWAENNIKINENVPKLSEMTRILDDTSLNNLIQDALTTLKTNSVQGTILSQLLQLKLTSQDFKRLLPEHIEENLEELILYLGVDKIQNALKAIKSKNAS